MNAREKITLTKEQETLLIPLYSKAKGNPIFTDEKSRQVLDRIQYDFQALRIPQKTAVTLGIRAKQLDEFTREFLAGHPGSMVLHLGCGLDSRCLRVPAPHALWYDLDLPDVIDLRRKFYPETDTYHMIASSVTDLAWLDQVPSHPGPSVFVVAEGLLMYLHEHEVRQLFLALHQKFPGCSLVCDVFSKLTAQRVQAHPSLHKTGAAIHWGIDDPHEIEGWTAGENPGIRLKEEWFFSQSPDIDRLGWFYRWMFRLAGSIKPAQKAQRLLYYTL